MKFVVALAAALGAVATGVHAADLTQATEGFTYFNRPGADLNGHNQALTNCIDLVDEAPKPIKLGMAPILMFGAIPGALIELDQARKASLRSASPSVEDCMVADGWRVVRLEPSEGRALIAGSQPEMRDRLVEWVGSATPHGVVARTFENEGAGASKPNYEPAPRPAVGAVFVSLSLTELAAAEPLSPEVAPPPTKPVPPKIPASARPIKVVKQPPATLEGAALVVLTLRGTSAARDQTLGFLRAGPNLRTPAWLEDDRPDRFTAAFGPAGKTPEDQTFLFVVPPGAWSLTDRTRGFFGPAFCRGAPTMTVGTGEVVDLGVFDLSADHFGPSHDTKIVEVALRGHPDLVSKARPAVFKNGARTRCTAPYVYALTLGEGTTN